MLTYSAAIYQAAATLTLHLL